MSIKNIGSTEALALLSEGNMRFMTGLRSVESIATSSKLKELAEKGQKPFAIVLTCSDSRVPCEIIFDRGLGDLFVIRVAGNIVSPSIIGSIEFAASSFGTALVVVMGHSQCGAVKAAVQSEVDGAEDCPSNLGKIVRKVRPAVRSAVKSLGLAAEALEFQRLVDRSTIENVRRSAAAVTRKSPVLGELAEAGKVMVVGALYDLHTGKVEFELPGLSPMRKPETGEGSLACIDSIAMSS